jgi:hypothetical protein
VSLIFFIFVHQLYYWENSIPSFFHLFFYHQQCQNVLQPLRKTFQQTLITKLPAAITGDNFPDEEKEFFHSKILYPLWGLTNLLLTRYRFYFHEVN